MRNAMLPEKHPFSTPPRSEVTPEFEIITSPLYLENGALRSVLPFTMLTITTMISEYATSPTLAHCDLLEKRPRTYSVKSKDPETSSSQIAIASGSP